MESCHSAVLLRNRGVCAFLTALSLAFCAMAPAWAEDYSIHGAWESTRFEPATKEVDSMFFVFQENGRFSVTFSLKLDDSQIKTGESGAFKLAGNELTLNLPTTKNVLKVTIEKETLKIVDEKQKTTVYFKRVMMK